MTVHCGACPLDASCFAGGRRGATTRRHAGDYIGSFRRQAVEPNEAPRETTALCDLDTVVELPAGLDGPYTPSSQRAWSDGTPPGAARNGYGNDDDDLRYKAVCM